MEEIVFKPQPGKQEMFLKHSADICIYGGAAGGGKSYALLLEPGYHIDNPNFEAVVFRQQRPQILNAGGLWDVSCSIYPYYGATSTRSPKLTWTFPSGAKVTFAHLGLEKELHYWQGSQIPLMMFDELTHFSEKMFFYMLSRNRSMCGVKPYVRATCNPDADSWVAKFIEWWIDQDTGYPIEERCGKVRWFIRRDETVYWAGSKQELWEQFNLNTIEERQEPKSVAFVNSTLQDNQILMKTDPSYMANLKALPTVERERLLFGNWKIKPAAGLFFNRKQIGDFLPVVPKDVVAFVRAWDLAATSETEGGEPAYTAGVLMGKRSNGRYIVIDVINVRLSAGDVRSTIRHTAMIDNAKYGNVKIRLPQDPGQAGKDQAQSFIKLLAGFSVKTIQETGSKETRAEPVAAQWQAGNFDVVVGKWNEEYFSQLESFPSSKFKDMVDATSTAFAELVQITEYDKLIYPTFSETENVCEENSNVADNGETRRYIAVNYSSVSPMVFLEILDDGDMARVRQEYYNAGKCSEKEYADDFERFAGNSETVSCVILDESAATFKNELRNRGYRVRTADEDVRNGISKVNAMFSANKLIISRSCDHLISEIRGYKWDEKAVERGEEKPVKYNDSACEALRKGISTAVYNKRRLSEERN